MSRKRKSKKINNSRIVIIFSIIVFLVVFMILFISQRKQNENYNSIKEDKNNYLVYTKYQKEGEVFSVYIPYINIDSKIVKEVNEDIDLFTSEFINSKKAMISYEYDINGIILSVIIKIVDYDTEYAPEPYFRTYNINLDTLELISDEALLEYFNISDTDVEMKMENQFQAYYEKIVEKGYYTKEECDYNCFLKYRGIDNYIDRVSYYIEDGSLVVYKPFVFYSVFGEEDYFKDKHFKFLIVKKES